MEKYLIIIPRIDTTGPIRGAIAAANLLSKNNNEVIIYAIYGNN